MRDDGRFGGGFYGAKSGGGHTQRPGDLLSGFFTHRISVQRLSIHVSYFTEQFSDSTRTFDVHRRFRDQMGTCRHLRVNVLLQDGEDVGSETVRIVNGSFSDALDDQREHLPLPLFKLVLT